LTCCGGCGPRTRRALGTRRRAARQPAAAASTCCGGCGPRTRRAPGMRLRAARLPATAASTPYSGCGLRTLPAPGTGTRAGSTLSLVNRARSPLGSTAWPPPSIRSLPGADAPVEVRARHRIVRGLCILALLFSSFGMRSRPEWFLHAAPRALSGKFPWLRRCCVTPPQGPLCRRLGWARCAAPVGQPSALQGTTGVAVGRGAPFVGEGHRGWLHPTVTAGCRVSPSLASRLCVPGRIRVGGGDPAIVIGGSWNLQLQLGRRRRKRRAGPAPSHTTAPCPAEYATVTSQ
jgi:hypothetical protein